MAYIYFSKENKLKKLYIYILIYILLNISSFIIYLITDNKGLDNRILVYSLGRSLAFIPYIIYKLFFSSKSENQLSSNFCIKDWIIFILMIFLQSLYNLINNNYFIIINEIYE